MSDSTGRPTTALLKAAVTSKPTRLVPRGLISDGQFANRCHCPALLDADFGDAHDRVRYAIDVNAGDGPFEVDAKLRFQVIGFRWAENLRPYGAEETRRFVGYYESMASSSSEVLVARRQRIE